MNMIGHNSARGGRMYAITFDLDTQTLEQSYGNASWRNAYADIRNALRNHGFDWQQGSVHFGDETVNAVSCVLAVQDLTRRFPWFRPSVRDMRMLRIEENNDLGPAIEQAANG
ncbi:virulence factor [Mesorhizobium xinjiangense]|uniref:virulence factor n=1 Tax=Mesorhizobium xinjiangense TaxID=2678685 RepID=UPI001F33E813|nr:virulence factor [Mesorhizobium xinjiangense]